MLWVPTAGLSPSELSLVEGGTFLVDTERFMLVSGERSQLRTEAFLNFVRPTLPSMKAMCRHYCQSKVPEEAYVTASGNDESKIEVLKRRLAEAEASLKLSHLKILGRPSTREKVSAPHAHMFWGDSEQDFGSDDSLMKMAARFKKKTRQQDDGDGSESIGESLGGFGERRAHMPQERRDGQGRLFELGGGSRCEHSVAVGDVHVDAQGRRGRKRQRQRRRVR